VSELIELKHLKFEVCIIKNNKTSFVKKRAGSVKNGGLRMKEQASKNITSNLCKPGASFVIYGGRTFEV
jgi:hypothetical protein